MICHGGNNSAVPPTLSGHYFSKDLGRSWVQAGLLPPYSHNTSWSNGSSQPLARCVAYSTDAPLPSVTVISHPAELSGAACWCRRERPSLVLEPGTGRPLALINGALNLAGVGRQQAYTLTVPIRHAASDSGAKQ